MGPNSRGAATVCPLTSFDPIIAKNPLYVDCGDMDMLLGEDGMPDDSIFPRGQKMLELTARSACEATCFEEKLKT